MDKQRVTRFGTEAEARMHARYVAFSISNISEAVNQKPSLRAHKSCLTRECKQSALKSVRVRLSLLLDSF